MQAVWNVQKNAYDITMTAEELGTNIFALQVARDITKDSTVAELCRSFLNIGEV